jgi:hypothetical protein
MNKLSQLHRLEFQVLILVFNYLIKPLNLTLKLLNMLILHLLVDHELLVVLLSLCLQHRNHLTLLLYLLIGLNQMIGLVDLGTFAHDLPELGLCLKLPQSLLQA